MSIIHIASLFGAWLIFWVFKYNGSILDNFLLLGSFVYLILFCKEYNKRIQAKATIEKNLETIEEYKGYIEASQDELSREKVVGRAMQIKEEIELFEGAIVDLGVENRMLKGEGK